MSLYADYLAERENKRTIESEDGFIIYLFDKAECYIQDIYVKPESRNKNVASELADQVICQAKYRGIRYITGSVCVHANHATRSLKVLLAYGFKLLRSTPDMIWFIIDLQDDNPEGV